MDWAENRFRPVNWLVERPHHEESHVSQLDEKWCGLPFICSCPQWQQGFRSVYLKHQPTANTCHFKGATFQNIHINPPVTLSLSHTHTSPSRHQSEGSAPIHSQNWYCSLWHTPIWGNVFISSFFWSQTCGRHSLGLPLRAIRAASGGKAMKMMMMDPHNRSWVLPTTEAHVSIWWGPKQVPPSQGCVRLYVDVIYIERESHVTSSIIWHLGLRLLWETVQTHTQTQCCSDNVIWKMTQCTKKMTKLSVDAWVCVVQFILYKTM